MVQVTAVGPDAEAFREVLSDERIEEVANVLPVDHTGKSHVLSAQAIPTVQGDERQKPCLSACETESLNCLNPFLEGHDNRSRWWGSKGVPPRWSPWPRAAPAPAARYSAKPAACLPAS